MRLRPLRNLAAAFGVVIDKEGTKQDILPAMIAAERRGVFKNVQAADKALLIRASWTSDMGDFPKEEIEALEIKPEPERHVIDQTPAQRDAVAEWQDLRKEVKERLGPDFQIHGKKKDELLQALEEHRSALDGTVTQPLATAHRESTDAS